jgi:hypothetical protein
MVHLDFENSMALSEDEASAVFEVKGWNKI